MIQKVLSVFFLAIAIGEVSYGYNVCPDPKEIAPCTCEGVSSAVFKCEKISAVDELRNAFISSSVRNVSSVNINEVVLMYVPTEIFDNFHMDRLIIRNSTFTGLFPKVPPKNDLQELRVEDSNIHRGFVWRHMLGMKHLKSLKIINTRNVIIDDDFSTSISSGVRELIFRETRIRRIPATAFENFNFLENVDLSNNSISSVSSRWFVGDKFIRSINLNNNKIASLPKGAFANLPYLESLTLRGNKLNKFSGDVFDNKVPKKIYIDLTGNHIPCDCDIYWMLHTLFHGTKFSGTCFRSNFETKLNDLTSRDFHCLDRD